LILPAAYGRGRLRFYLFGLIRETVAPALVFDAIKPVWLSTYSRDLLFFLIISLIFPAPAGRSVPRIYFALMAAGRLGGTWVCPGDDFD